MGIFGPVPGSRPKQWHSPQVLRPSRFQAGREAAVNGGGPNSVENYLEVTPEYKPFGRGITPGIGDLQSPWLSTTYDTWDDPPSSLSYG